MTYIPEALRRLVFQRADNCCEYCLLHEDDNLFAHEADHIIAEKHRGKTEADNLCVGCFDCNRNKGSDIASIDEDTGLLTPLFNPRRDLWTDHFQLRGAEVKPLTAVGRVTVFLLQINDLDQVNKREGLSKLNRYPCYAGQTELGTE